MKGWWLAVVVLLLIGCGALKLVSAQAVVEPSWCSITWTGGEVQARQVGQPGHTRLRIPTQTDHGIRLMVRGDSD